MNEIDALATTLFEQAKRFLEKAREAVTDESEMAFLHAALLLAFSSLEAHVNAVAEELAARPDLDILALSVLREREFKLDDSGSFRLSPNALKMYRLEDRLLYIFANHSRSPSLNPKSTKWWGPFKEAATLRNQLVHPKTGVTIDVKKVAEALTAVLGCLDDLYRAIFQRPFPTVNRGLDSKLSF